MPKLVNKANKKEKTQNIKPETKEKLISQKFKESHMITIQSYMSKLENREITQISKLLGHTGNKKEKNSSAVVTRKESELIKSNPLPKNCSALDDFTTRFNQLI